MPSAVDETNDIYVETGDYIYLTLKWNDPWDYSNNDYDLYLWNPAMDGYWVSNTRQDGDTHPYEWLLIQAPYTGYYHIAILNYQATGTVRFHLYSLIQDLEYQVASMSLAVPADSPYAMSMGAVPWDNPGTLESFSSQGPTDDGRIKPDLVAPDYVSTATYGLHAFGGTSPCAPLGAGAAALVKQAHPRFTPDQIQAFLEQEAATLGAPQKNNLSGAGRLNLYPRSKPG